MIQRCSRCSRCSLTSRTDVDVFHSGVRQMGYELAASSYAAQREEGAWLGLHRPSGQVADLTELGLLRCVMRSRVLSLIASNKVRAKASSPAIAPGPRLWPACMSRDVRQLARSGQSASTICRQPTFFKSSDIPSSRVLLLCVMSTPLSTVFGRSTARNAALSARGGTTSSRDVGRYRRAFGSMRTKYS